MKKAAASLVLFASLLLPASVFAAPPPINISNLFAIKQIRPVSGSEPHGLVSLSQIRSGNGGTKVTLLAFGLQPGKQYISLYYGNHVCAIEPYEESDIIANYSGDRIGVASIHTQVSDDLDEINSVSIRDASNFQLLACADIHP